MIHSLNQIEINELQFAATSLQNLLFSAAEKSIPKFKFSDRSKPWWSEKISKLRRNLSSKRRNWKRNQSQNQLHYQYTQARNQYFQEIKLAKNKCWNDFLENADSEQVYKAYKYCNQRRLEKTPVICYNNTEKAISFNDKCKIFLNTLLPANSDNMTESIDPAYFAVNDTNLSEFCPESYSSNESKWKWPKLTINELENAIFSSSTKKAAGSDKINFLIIQKAYSIIPQLFYQLYSKLIEVGFHPECWKEEIGVILKKPNRENSNPKSYRLVSLLNCLGKIAEKLIAERLAFYAETTDLLYNDQIGARKQRSAIDAAISIVSEIELNKHKKKLSSMLLMDIRGAFPNMNRAQLLKTCCKLKLPRACISWIHSFCHSRLMKLAFDGEIMKKTVTIYTGVPQGSPVSPILFLIYINQLFKNQSDLSVKMPSYMDDIAILASSKSIHENCKILQNAAKKLIDWGRNHHIEFDMNKTELIHFDHAERSMNKSVKILENTISSKETIKYLEI